jgi:hypothetical protein
MYVVLGDQQCKQARIYHPDHAELHKTSGGSWVTVRVHPHTCFAKTRDSLAGVSLFLSYSQCCRVAETRLLTRSAGLAYGRGPAVHLATLRSFSFVFAATPQLPLARHYVWKLFSVLHALTSKADAHQVWRPNTVPPQVENGSYETNEYNRHHFCIAIPYTTVIPLSSH